MNDEATQVGSEQENYLPNSAGADNGESNQECTDIIRTLPDGFSVCDSQSANWVIRRVMEARAYGKRVTEWAAAEVARAKNDEARLLYIFGGQLKAWATEEIQRLGGRRKSVCLPAGSLGCRREPVRLVIDDDSAVINWAQCACPKAIATIIKLNKTTVIEHFKTTGEIPDSGAHIEPERDYFSIR